LRDFCSMWVMMASRFSSALGDAEGRRRNEMATGGEEWKRQKEAVKKMSKQVARELVA
jgi:hypothetical protein